MEEATFGAGCFWCVEAVFQNVKGVEKVISGYMGGQISNPTYREVCSGRTGHAEVARIVYDPEVVNFNTLLEVFFGTHDPTTLNRQGNDVGSQYRSVIFYHNDKQRGLADSAKKALNDQEVYPNPVVTEISEVTTFYEAEDYHQNYLNRVGDENPYCTMVVKPKVEKFKKAFSSLLKQ
jgi:peptide-methionine (S)-S-oxide reductase